MNDVFRRSRPEACLSDRTIDRLLAGDLSAEEDKASREHLATCALCQARQAEIEEAKASFQLPLEAKAAPRRGARFIRRAAVAGMALAAALALFAVRLPSKDGARVKGEGFHLAFYVKHGEKVRRGAWGEVVAPQDALRFAYSSLKPGYFTVMSRDPTGAVSIYYASKAPEPAGTEVAVEASTILDDSTGKEMLYGLFCETRPDPKALLESTAAAVVRFGCSIEQVAIEKRPEL